MDMLSFERHKQPCGFYYLERAKMKPIILIFALACASAPAPQYKPLMYTGMHGKCPLVKLEFNTYPGHTCYCKVENDQGNIQVYLPIRNIFCDPPKTIVEEVK